MLMFTCYVVKSKSVKNVKLESLVVPGTKNGQKGSRVSPRGRSLNSFRVPLKNVSQTMEKFTNKKLEIAQTGQKFPSKKFEISNLG